MSRADATATSGVLAYDVCFQDAAKLISTADMGRKSVVARSISDRKPASIKPKTLPHFMGRQNLTIFVHPFSVISQDGDNPDLTQQ